MPPKSPEPDQPDYEVPDVEGIEDSANEVRDPVEFWIKKQRDLVSSVVDYNLSAVAELIETKRIDLSPEYQRRHRWNPARQSLLIESFLMNVPVPPVFLNEDQLGKYSVIDGKQRLYAIYLMLRGRLKLTGLEVFSDINGKTFDELPSELQTVLQVRPTIRAVIVLRQSDPDIKFEVFQRLNTGGVKLNNQEIRNSTFTGKLNNLVLRLSEDAEFHRLLRIREKSKSKLYQEMRDAEFVVRFMSFKDSWANLSGGLMRSMNRFMDENRNPTNAQLAALEATFRQAVRAAEAAFGEHAFQRWVPERGEWRAPVLASLYDAEMFAVHDLDVGSLRMRQGAILEGLKKLFEHKEFRKAIDSATNASSAFRGRIAAVREVVKSCL